MPLDGGRTCGDRRHDRSPRSGRDGRRRCRRPRMRRHRPTAMNATVRHRQFNRRGKPHGTDSSARHPTALLAAFLAALRAVIARGHDHGRYAPFRGDSDTGTRRSSRASRSSQASPRRSAGCRLSTKCRPPYRARCPGSSVPPQSQCERCHGPSSACCSATLPREAGFRADATPASDSGLLLFRRRPAPRRLPSSRPLAPAVSPASQTRHTALIAPSVGRARIADSRRHRANARLAWHARRRRVPIPAAAPETPSRRVNHRHDEQRASRSFAVYRTAKGRPRHLTGYLVDIATN